MSLAQKTTASPVSDRVSRRRPTRQRVRVAQATITQNQQALQERCSALREQRRFLTAYRQSFQEERLLLWKHCQGFPLETSTCNQQAFQERQQDYEEFQQHLHQQAATFGIFHQVLGDKLRILREQRRTVRALPDPAQRQQALHELQAKYLHLQQALWEQHAIYRQLRLDYQAHCTLLHAEKPVRQQRQETLHRQGYGDFF